MAYYNVSVQLEDERGNYGFVRGRFEAANDASAITEAQSLATWTDDNSGAKIIGISLTELFEAEITAAVKAVPNTGCEVEAQVNLLFKTASPNPNKTYNVFVPTAMKSDFEAKGKRLTDAAKTAWGDALTAASGATEYFADSGFFRLDTLIRGKEKWTKVRKR